MTLLGRNYGSAADVIRGRNCKIYTRGLLNLPCMESGWVWDRIQGIETQLGQN